MKVTKVSTRIVDAEMRNRIFVHFETGVEGPRGRWIIKDLEPPTLMGDPRDIEQAARGWPCTWSE